MKTRLLLLISFGSIIVSFSEFWFYKVDKDVGHFTIILAYGVMGYFFLVALKYYEVRTMAAFWVAASLFGFLAEGVPVAVLYSGLPLTIVWTSLAWHALLSVGIGWFAFKKIMGGKSILRAVLLNAAIGLGLGLWNGYMWNAVIDDTSEVLSFAWQRPEIFTKQFLIGYVLFVIGHFVFERSARTVPDFKTFEILALGIILAVISLLGAAASGLWIFFPILPFLVFICILALQRSKNTVSQEPELLTVMRFNKIPVWRYALTLLIPLVAISTYFTVFHLQIGLEMNAIVIAIAGPVSLFLFARGIWKCMKN
ncbi:MAG: hypothetical protein V3V13_10260 [Paracoccaceae bacterium]